MLASAACENSRQSNVVHFRELFGNSVPNRKQFCNICLNYPAATLSSLGTCIGAHTAASCTRFAGRSKQMQLPINHEKPFSSQALRSCWWCPTVGVVWVDDLQVAGWPGAGAAAMSRYVVPSVKMWLLRRWRRIAGSFQGEQSLTLWIDHLVTSTSVWHQDWPGTIFWALFWG